MAEGVRVQLDEALAFVGPEVMGERWAITGGFWLPLGVQVELSDSVAAWKCCQWLRASSLADDFEVAELDNCYIDVPPKPVIDAVRATPAAAWVYRLRLQR